LIAKGLALLAWPDHVGKTRDRKKERKRERERERLCTHVGEIAAERIMRMQQAMQIFEVGPGLINVQLQEREAVLSSDAILALDAQALVKVPQLVHVAVEQAGGHLRGRIVH